MPVNITEDFIRYLMKQNEEQNARIAELSSEIARRKERTAAWKH